MERKTDIRNDSPVDFDVEFWSKIDAQEKFKIAWDLVLRFKIIRGDVNVIQSRLQRSVESVVRKSS